MPLRKKNRFSKISGKIRFRIFFPILILIGFIFFVFYWTQPAGEYRLARIIESQIGRQLQADIQIASFETNLISRFVFRDLQIKYAHQLGGINIACKDLKVFIRPFDFIKGKIRISEVRIDSLSATNARSATEASDPVSETQPMQNRSLSTKPFQLQIDEIQLTRGSLVYADTAYQLDAGIQNFQFHAEGPEQWQWRSNADTIQVGRGCMKLPVTEFYAAGSFFREAFSIDSIRFDLCDLKAAGNAQIELEDNPLLNAVLDIRGNPQSLSDLFRDCVSDSAFIPDGLIGMRLTANGPVNQLDVRGDIHFDELRYDSLQFRDGRIRFGWQDQTISVDTLQMHGFEGCLTASGHYRIAEDPEFDFQAGIHSISVASVWSVIFKARSPFQGRGAGKLLFYGQGSSPSNWKGHVDLVTNNLAYQGQRVSEMELQAQLQEGTLLAHFQQSQTDVEIQLNLAEKEMSGSYSVQLLRLQPVGRLINQPGLTGSFQAEGQIRGSYHAPKISADVLGEKIRFREIPLDRIEGKILYDAETLTFQSLRFEGSRSLMDTVSILDLPDFSGGFAYAGSVRGTPENLQGELMCFLDHPAWKTCSLDSAFFRITSAEDTVRLERMELVRDSTSLHGFGHFLRSEESGEAVFRLSSLSHPAGTIKAQLRSVAGSPVISMTGTDVQVSPIMSMIKPDLRLSGHLNWNFETEGLHKIHLKGNVTGIQLTSLAADSFRFHLQCDSRWLTIHEMALFQQDHQTLVKAQLPLLPSEKQDIYIDTNREFRGEWISSHFEFGFLDPILPNELSLSGQGDINLHANGKISDPELNGIVSAENLVVSRPQQSILTQGQIEVVFENRHLDLAAFTGSVFDVPFFLRGEADLDVQEIQAQAQVVVANQNPLHIEGELDQDVLRIVARLSDWDMESVDPFLPEPVSVAGKMNLDAVIEGSIRDPNVTGMVHMTDVSARPVDWMEPLTQGSLRLRFQKDHIEIDTCSFRTQGGGIDFRGNLHHQNRKWKAFQLAGEVRELRLMQKDRFDAQIHAMQLNLNGQSRKGKILADIIMGESRYKDRINVKQILNQFRASERETTGPAATDIIWDLDIRIHDSPDLWMDNNLARVRFQPELELKGNSQRPVVIGRLEAAEGTVNYLDRRFQIQTGTLDFADPYQINPILNVEAVAELKSYQTYSEIPYTIYFSAKGPADQPVITLTSEPALSQSDIVTLLTLGTTRSSATSSESSRRDVTMGEALKDRAAVVSSQRISNYAARKIGTLFGMEEISIEGNLFRFGKSWGPQLLASKKITPRMEVSYSSTIGNMNDQSIKLDYKLTEKFSIEGQTDQRGRAGLDLKYRIKFK